MPPGVRYYDYLDGQLPSALAGEKYAFPGHFTEEFRAGVRRRVVRMGGAPVKERAWQPPGFSVSISLSWLFCPCSTL